jgi:hypothetical protein
VSQQVGIINADNTGLEWISLEAANLRLDLAAASRQEDIWTARIPQRFGADGLALANPPVSYRVASAEQRRWLSMSQTEWTRFLAGRIQPELPAVADNVEGQDGPAIVPPGNGQN